MSTLWMYRLKVSTRLCLRVFFAPVDAVFAAFAVFLEGAALAIWGCAGCLKGVRVGEGERGAQPPAVRVDEKRGCADHPR